MQGMSYFVRLAAKLDPWERARLTRNTVAPNKVFHDALWPGITFNLALPIPGIWRARRTRSQARLAQANHVGG